MNKQNITLGVYDNHEKEMHEICSRGSLTYCIFLNVVNIRRPTVKPKLHYHPLGTKHNRHTLHLAKEQNITH